MKQGKFLNQKLKEVISMETRQQKLERIRNGTTRKTQELYDLEY